MKSKVYHYPCSISYLTKEGQEVNIHTQLYALGLYVIINNDPAKTFSTPQSMEKQKKKLIEAEKEGLIRDLRFGPEYSAVKIDNFWQKNSYML